MKSRAILLFLLSVFLIPGLVQAQQLSAAQQQDLLYMREEEKLARDVYQYLYEQWNLPIFANIAVSEQRHMDAVLTLLNLYGISDPVGTNAVGVFTNSTLQGFYDQLTAQGAASVIAALEVGIYIEDTDIGDLETALSIAEVPAIVRVYNNLLKGSNNHLAAFINNLEAQGGSFPNGNQAGSSESPGTAVYEPISESLYIPALDVDDGSGNIVVHDVLLRLVETVPQTFQAVSASATDRTANPELHASFNLQTGELLIRDLVVGSLVVDSVSNAHYTVTMQMDMSTSDDFILTVTNITAK